MNKLNYPALGAIALSVLSVFLPWVQVSPAAGTYDLSEVFQPLTISGISIGYGIIGLLVALLGALLAYKEYKWAFIAGLVNLIDGYGYLHGWFGAGTHDSGNYGDVTSRSTVDYKLGLYLFVIASLAFVFFTLKNLKAKKNTEKEAWREPEQNESLYEVINTKPTHNYQPSNIRTMTTSSETPTGPEPKETPKVPVQPAETEAGQPSATPPVTAQPSETSAGIGATSDQPVAAPIATKPTGIPPSAGTGATSDQPVAAPTATKPAEPAHVYTPAPEPVYQAPKAAATPQPPYVEPQKKSATPWILSVLLILVLVSAGIFIMNNNTSQESKTEQSVNEEKARLQVIVNDVNNAVSDKKYDDALLKVNSINWLYAPDANKGYVEQYNSQRENLRHTIEQLKTNQIMDDQKQAAEKAEKVTSQPVDSINK